MKNPEAIIIEDDVSLAEMFAESLKAAGYSCEIMYDGEKALAYLEEHFPLLVVLDLYLPKVSGEEILKFIHSSSDLINTHVIIVSADAFYAETLREDVDFVMVKPVSYQQLHDLAIRLKN